MSKTTKNNSTSSNKYKLKTLYQNNNSDNNKMSDTQILQTYTNKIEEDLKQRIGSLEEEKIKVEEENKKLRETIRKKEKALNQEEKYSQASKALMSMHTVQVSVQRFCMDSDFRTSFITFRYKKKIRFGIQ